MIKKNFKQVSLHAEMDNGFFNTSENPRCPSMLLEEEIYWVFVYSLVADNGMLKLTIV